MYPASNRRTVVHRPGPARVVGASAVVPAHSSHPGPKPRGLPAAVWSPRPFRPSPALVHRAFRRTLGGPIAAVPAAVLRFDFKAFIETVWNSRFPALSGTGKFVKFRESQELEDSAVKFQDPGVDVRRGFPNPPYLPVCAFPPRPSDRPSVKFALRYHTAVRRAPPRVSRV